MAVGLYAPPLGLRLWQQRLGFILPSVHYSVVLTVLHFQRLLRRPLHTVCPDAIFTPNECKARLLLGVFVCSSWSSLLSARAVFLFLYDSSQLLSLNTFNHSFAKFADPTRSCAFPASWSDSCSSVMSNQRCPH
jgi:hypothetical protein